MPIILESVIQITEKKSISFIFNLNLKNTGLILLFSDLPWIVCVTLDNLKSQDWDKSSLNYIPTMIQPVFLIGSQDVPSQ